MKKEGAEHETNWKSGSGLRRRQDVLLQVGSEKVCVHVGAGPERNTLHAAWDDDDAIQRIVHELNFGRYAAGRNGLHTAQQDCPVGRGKEKSA